MDDYDGYIEIKLPRCRVCLTAEEINRLLQKDPELFARAIRRGKTVNRARLARGPRIKTDTS